MPWHNSCACCRRSSGKELPMLPSRYLFLMPLLFLATSASAQDVASGQEKGTEVPALKVFDATGLHQGQEVDYAAERKGKPTVYVFIQADKWDRPMARFPKGLDES